MGAVSCLSCMSCVLISCVSYLSCVSCVSISCVSCVELHELDSRAHKLCAFNFCINHLGGCVKRAVLSCIHTLVAIQSDCCDTKALDEVKRKK